MLAGEFLCRLHPQTATGQHPAVYSLHVEERDNLLAWVADISDRTEKLMHDSFGIKLQHNLDQILLRREIFVQRPLGYSAADQLRLHSGRMKSALVEPI